MRSVSQIVIREGGESMTAIKKFRKEKNWTQAQLAEHLNVTQSAVGMWESGVRKPDIITLKKLAQIFNCTTDDLLKDISTEN